jgi:hypothetical protein
LATEQLLDEDTYPAEECLSDDVEQELHFALGTRFRFGRTTSEARIAVSSP